MNIAWSGFLYRALKLTMYTGNGLGSAAGPSNDRLIADPPPSVPTSMLPVALFPFSKATDTVVLVG